MKKCLTLIALMFSLASFAVTVAPWDEPLVIKSVDPTNYYWFDASTQEYLQQNTIEDEMWITEYNESTYLPKTLREEGYAPSSVWVDENGYPHINVMWPDKRLYSHP